MERSQRLSDARKRQRAGRASSLPPTRSADPITFAAWSHLFRFRVTWGLLLGFFGTVYLVWLYQAWLPGYLETQRGLSLVKTGWIAAIPNAFGVCGSISMGFVADSLMARSFTPAFVVAAVVGLASAVVYLFVLPARAITAEEVTGGPGITLHGSAA